MQRIVKNNTVAQNLWEAVHVTCSNVQIAENIVDGPLSCFSPSDCNMEYNIIVGETEPIIINQAGPTITTKYNITKDDSGVRFI